MKKMSNSKQNSWSLFSCCISQSVSTTDILL